MLPVVAKSPTLSLYGIGLKYDVTAKTVTLLNQTTETLSVNVRYGIFFFPFLFTRFLSLLNPLSSSLATLTPSVAHNGSGQTSGSVLLLHMEWCIMRSVTHFFILSPTNLSNVMLINSFFSLLGAASRDRSVIILE